MALVDEQITGPEEGKPKQTVEGALRPLVKSPAEDFAVTLMSISDDFGVLDSAFAKEGANSSFVGTPTGAEIDLLAGKWKAIPRNERRAILSEMTKKDPQFTQQFLAAVGSRD